MGRPSQFLAFMILCGVSSQTSHCRGQCLHKTEPSGSQSNDANLTLHYYSRGSATAYRYPGTSEKLKIRYAFASETTAQGEFPMAVVSVTSYATAGKFRRQSSSDTRALICYSRLLDMDGHQKKAHRRRRPADYIPRPSNPFILFRCHFCQQDLITPSTDNSNKQGNTSRVAGHIWRAMSKKSEKAPWEQRAELAKQEHRMKYPGYKFKPGPARGKRKTRKTPVIPGKLFEEFHPRAGEWYKISLFYNSQLVPRANSIQGGAGANLSASRTNSSAHP